MHAMKRATYRSLQSMAVTLCAISTVAFAEVLPAKQSMSSALIGVGSGDWIVTALLGLSFGLVSLLQRFKRSEAGEHYIIFVAAHMGGSLICAVMAYLLTQSAFDSPNRFAQALTVGVAGWLGSSGADMIASNVFGRLLGGANSPGKV